MSLINDLPAERSSSRSEQRLVLLIVAMLAVFLAWATSFTLSEVSSGQGKVVPSAREQVIQSLEGGIVAAISVTEGDVVEKDQVLAQLDPTRTASNVEEAAAKYRASIAAAARLRAELKDAGDVEFPPELQHPDFGELRANERALFQSRQSSFQDSLSGLMEGQKLLQEELEIVERLQGSGAASRIEVIRLQREANKTELEITRLRAERRVEVGEELQRANAEAEVQASIMRGRNDMLERLIFRAPKNGIVKNVAVTTIGGVVPPGGELMTIVPRDNEMLIETRISPRDIAYIHPGQEALVKVTAYDYAIFGGLEGIVSTISPDTVRDEVDPKIVYYRVYIRTRRNHLLTEDGRQLPIVPGMIATVDIKTGEKTVWQYIVKPFNRAQEALRER